ncbi:MAG TPA: phosphoribosylglycinamide formyltransferase [Bacteroidales bacterium]|nr:phosphoribosylglycinamide formyltransferase [Bacteroidales bacterium]HPR11492.1 phosphoribosylglycinamide formyltransferase [Bacteroidales bacterium]HRW84234.1 phosphoribosylglycinamide formyltransferase [Bacteroidales bacterium]
MKNITIFASGSGTNAENIIKHFSTGNFARVSLVLSNRREAYVLHRAEALNIKTIFFDRNDFYTNGKVLQALYQANPDLIVLAGFLWLVPEEILKAFEGRIINIHPALLPQYGGKGMYGDRVHTAVIENGDTESGITIHYVNKRYDEGNIIFQARCRIDPGDTPETLAARVHSLEYKYYPTVIEDLLKKLP